MKSFLAAVALFAFSFSANAALNQYKNWENSPQGYFMTAAERAEWKTIDDDARAAEFVKSFIERRGGDKWVAEVKKRADMADKYLSLGKVMGSTTLRGKLIVLFGAPADIQVSSVTRGGNTGGGSNGLGSTVVTNVGSSSGMSSGEALGDPDAAGRGGAATGSRTFKIYTFTFSNKTTPALGKSDYVTAVEVDTGNGRDRLRDGKKQAELDALLEAVAAASIVK